MADETRLKERFDAGDFDGAMTLAIEMYGNELYGFLVGLARDATHADDVFGSTCERLWKGLASFRWQSTLRVWAYTVARNEFLRSTRSLNRAKLHDPISQVVQQAIDRAKSTTPVHLRSEVHARFAKIRDQLESDDHMLLGLRIDREMGWSEIAEILGGDAATLRKRYERLKDKLRKLVDET